MSTRITTGVRSRGGNSTTPPQIVPIDVDLIDDDVILSSPRSFAEAQNNSRRNRGGVLVVDLDAEDLGSIRVNVICNAETSSSHLNDRNINSRAPRHQQVINLESRTANSGMWWSASKTGGSASTASSATKGTCIQLSSLHRPTSRRGVNKVWSYLLQGLHYYCHSYPEKSVLHVGGR